MLPGFIRAKGKLQHLHTGKTALVPQGLNFICYNPQIFCNYRKVSKLCTDSLKKLITGTLAPLAIYGCFLADRNRPVGFKTTEMIYAKNIC